MTFRIEEKISIVDLNIFEFKKWLFANKAEILHPTRIVNSIYFDNKLKMFSDSNEGIVPRKKIRVRTYNTKNFFSKKNKYSKETKITYYNYRYKNTENYSLSSTPRLTSLYDQDYGLCSPNLNVFYKRSYFKVFNTRITFDEEINYSLIKNNKLSNFLTRDKASVIEIKSPEINNTDFLKQILNMPRTRFSKYCRGIEHCL
tara:strand:- start:273 stop:875 length:603 start_codon:yes stop_codon:yes gene_type:complete